MLYVPIRSITLTSIKILMLARTVSHVKFHAVYSENELIGINPLVIATVGKSSFK